MRKAYKIPVTISEEKIIFSSTQPIETAQNEWIVTPTTTISEITKTQLGGKDFHLPKNPIQSPAEKLAVKKAPLKSTYYSTFTWKETGWGDIFKFGKFFSNVLWAKAKLHADQDKKVLLGLKPEKQTAYLNEAADMMYKVRIPPNVWTSMKYVMPVVSFLASPIRLFQKPEDVKNALLGRHFSVLWKETRFWDATKREIAGLAILEKTGLKDEAELSYWKHPSVSKLEFRTSVRELMSWSQNTSGYKNYIVHTEAPTAEQRGNPSSIHFAELMGLEKDGIRAPNDKDGNGKYTQILRAKNWAPEHALI